MEKYHYFIVDGASVVLPVTPERASWERSVNIEAINISAVGDVYRPGKPKRRRGQIEGFFPANDYPWLAPGAVADPYYYVNLFSSLMEQKTVVRYIIGGTEIIMLTSPELRSSPAVASERDWSTPKISSVL